MVPKPENLYYMRRIFVNREKKKKVKIGRKKKKKESKNTVT